MSDIQSEIYFTATRHRSRKKMIFDCISYDNTSHNKNFDNQIQNFYCGRYYHGIYGGKPRFPALMMCHCKTKF